MNRALKALLFSVLSSTAVALAAQSTTTPNPKNENRGGDEVLRCIYTPQADAQSSSLPTTRIGFKFSVERNNNNEIAADMYTLNDSSQPIKQIGHAELQSPITEITATTKAADFLKGISLAEDSPFDFAMTLSGLDSSSQEGRFNATVETATTFIGATYTQMTVSCRLPPAKK